MRTKEEILDNIEDWEEIRQTALENGKPEVAGRATSVINELKWVLEEPEE